MLEWFLRALGVGGSAERKRRPGRRRRVGPRKARVQLSAPVPKVSEEWWQPPTLEPGALQEVVGESHYQDSLVLHAGGKTPDGAAHPLLTAQLVADPSNRHDKFAVRVELNGDLVGHLPRGVSSLFQAVVIALAEEGTPATCRAWLTGGWDRDGGSGTIGVILDVALPPAPSSGSKPLFPWLVPECLGRGRGRLALVGEERFQGRLRALQARGMFVVRLCRSEAPPYKTSIRGPYLVAYADDHPIGMLTAQSAARYLPVVQEINQRGLEATCYAEVDPGNTKLEVQLWLCKGFTTLEGGWR